MENQRIKLSQPSTKDEIEGQAELGIISLKQIELTTLTIFPHKFLIDRYCFESENISYMELYKRNYTLQSWDVNV